MDYHLHAQTGSYSVKGGQISSKLESGYLILSNRKKCFDLIEKSELEDNDIADILISLHIVLEVSLNTLYRHLIGSVIKKEVNKLEVMENIDNINFIDKTVLFIYNSKFKFKDISKATEYHKIIGTLRKFSEARNKLLHGHSISTVFEGESKKLSKTKKMLNPQFLKEQIKRFCFIMEGMKFYIDCLDSELTEKGKEQYKKSYLDDSFIPILR